MRSIDSLLSEYGESHQNPTNKTVHWVCVPVIFWSIVALLWSVKLTIDSESPNPVRLNFAEVAFVFVVYYYVRLSFPLAIGMLLFALACMGLCHALELILPPSFPLWAFAITAFVLAWIGQFWGHKIEGKKPSFLKDIQFLLIGPAWLMHFIYNRVGIRY